MAKSRKTGQTTYVFLPGFPVMRGWAVMGPTTIVIITIATHAPRALFDVPYIPPISFSGMIPPVSPLEGTNLRIQVLRNRTLQTHVRNEPPIIRAFQNQVR